MELEKIAGVLEAAADYLDAIESEKQAAEKAFREQLITGFGEKYAAATGEEITDEVLQKLSVADSTLLGALDKLAETPLEKVAELGEPSQRRDFSVPMTSKEAAKAADERFLDFCLS